MIVSLCDCRTALYSGRKRASDKWPMLLTDMLRLSYWLPPSAHVLL